MAVGGVDGVAVCSAMIADWLTSSVLGSPCGSVERERGRGQTQRSHSR